MNGKNLIEERPPKTICNEFAKFLQSLTDNQQQLISYAVILT